MRFIHLLDAYTILYFNSKKRTLAPTWHLFQLAHFLHNRSDSRRETNVDAPESDHEDRAFERYREEDVSLLSGIVCPQPLFTVMICTISTLREWSVIAIEVCDESKSAEPDKGNPPLC